MSGAQASALPDSAQAQETETPLLAVRDLTVRYGTVVAIDSLSFDVKQGSVTGLIGPNGAGKTTLIDALTGFVKPQAGEVSFARRSVTGERAHRLAPMGMVRTFQSVELFDDLTVLENLLVACERPAPLAALGQIVRPRSSRLPEAVRWALEVTGLVGVARRYPKELSHGQRKVVGVARALAARPRLLLMDEPAAGLDTDETRALGQQLRTLPEHGVTLLLIDHDMGLVLSICEQVMVLDFGRLIASGTPQQIRVDQTVVDAYLGGQGG